jgi:hypothetical protein
MYNESLVIRQEVILDFDVIIINLNNELTKMNDAKEGALHIYNPNLLFNFLLTCEHISTYPTHD